eukprot:4219976-Pyramimonas_sp.AAC.1
MGGRIGSGRADPNGRFGPGASFRPSPTPPPSSSIILHPLPPPLPRSLLVPSPCASLVLLCPPFSSLRNPPTKFTIVLNVARARCPQSQG